MDNNTNSNDNSVNEVIEDLKNKIDDLEKAAALSDSSDAKQIKDKAVEVLSRVGGRFAEAARKVTDPEEIKAAVELVSARSKELYESSLDKIEEISGNKNIRTALDNASAQAEELKTKAEPILEDAVKDITELFGKTKDSIEEFAKREDVQQKVNAAKNETVELAEKGLAVLKEWLKPEGEDQ